MTSKPIEAPRQPRRLPHHPPPLRDETLESFIDRLARSNGLHYLQLFSQLTESRRRIGPVPVDRLALASGRDTTILRRALPELRFPELTGSTHPRRRHYIGTTAPCQHCTARHGISREQQVTVWTRVDHYLCLRHRRWIGHASLEQFSIADFPEIVKAQVRLRRLTNRYSPGRIYQAMGDATDILARDFDRDATRASRDRLARFFKRERTDRLPESYRNAAAFPDVVTLATFLASNFWRRMSTQDDSLFYWMILTLHQLGIIKDPYNLHVDLQLWTKIYGPTWPMTYKFRMAYARLETEQNRVD